MTDNPTHEKLANITLGFPRNQVSGDGDVRPITIAEMMQAIFQDQLNEWERLGLAPSAPVNG